MQKIVGDRLRPAGQKDPFGVEQARAQLQTALGVPIATWQQDLGDGRCVQYGGLRRGAGIVLREPGCPVGRGHSNAAAYLDQLMQRPSFARAVKEADPYRHLFPQS